MSRDVTRSETPIESMSQLAGYFEKGIKSPENRRIGTEHEKFIFQKSDSGVLTPAPFEGPRGIGRIFELLAERHNYEPSYDGPHIAALVRTNTYGDHEAITIEPGGQFELSGAPFAHLSETEAELNLHLDEVQAILSELGLVMIGTGINPLWPVDEHPWMPKSRYRIMRDYMTKVGTLGHWMMKMTCTIQANFDYTSEADAADLFKTALWISPIISALFAHSPVWNNKPSGYMTTRCHIWTKTDDDRCGFPLQLLEGDDFSFADYVQYALDVPMYFIHREGRYIDMSGYNLRAFIEDGYEGHSATMGDFELHLSTLFPEVRLKSYMEVRGADMGPHSHIMALPALWKGLLYDATSRSEARSLMADLPTDARHKLFDNATRWSLNGPVTANLGPDKVLIRHLAKTLLDLASDGLNRLSASDDSDEARYLKPLQQQLDAESPSKAHALLARWEALEQDTHAWILEQTLVR